MLTSRCQFRAVVGDLQAALADCSEALRLVPASPAALGSPVSLYGRGVAKRKKGDVAGGDADIAAAKAIRADVADLTAQWGVSAP